MKSTSTHDIEEHYKLRNVPSPKMIKATKEVFDPGFKDAFPNAKGNFLARSKSCSKTYGRGHPNKCGWKIYRGTGPWLHPFYVFARLCG